MSKARDIANILSANTAIATDAELTSAVSAHNSAIDPHGDRANTTTQIATHAAAADPHTVYLKSATAATTYAPKGAFNYVQTLGTRVTSVSGASAAIVSASITTNGYPVHVLVTGDAENNGAGAWARLQLFRGTTAIGNKVHVEGSAGSENIPFALQFIDAQPAGTYTYSIKTIDTAGGSFNFGESDGPTITLLELGR